jgi:hypothetical protein
MNSAAVERMAEEIVTVAEHVKHSVEEGREAQDVYRDLNRLRRSVETLEREIRPDSWSSQGDAC